MTADLTPAELKARLKALGLFGVISCCDEIIDKPWLREELAIEERERQKRALERRTRDAHVGAAKPMVDFSWSWPKKIDRAAIEELFSLNFHRKRPQRRARRTQRRRQNHDPKERRPASNQSWPFRLSYNSRYADLLFEVVTRRYDLGKPLLLSTNKGFSEWGEVFPHAAWVVTLIDRLIHRAEVIDIEADSYRLKEAEELSAARSKPRSKKAPAQA